MIIAGEADVTGAVLAAMEGSTDSRLREIMASLVKHLHGFVREVRLTEDEFRDATAYVAALGQATNDRHNEVVLMAGSLGISTLVCLLNNGNGGLTETSASLLGPFWRMQSPRVANGQSIVRSDTPGQPLFIRGRVTDQAGRPIEAAEVDVWHSSPAGLYENQDPAQADMNLRGKFTTDANGEFSLWSVRPSGYAIPTDGVVGKLLAAQHRHPYRPAHVHFLIFKPGFKTLISQVYLGGDQYLESDVQFGVTRALIVDLERHEEPAQGKDASPWFSLEHEFAMEPGEARLPRPPIK